MAILEKLKSPRTFTWAAVSLLILIGICMYFNCLGNEMFWDDDDFILKNRYIKDWQYFPRFFSENLVAGGYLISNYWRPLLLSVFAIEWHLWNAWVYGWHAVSVAFHIADGILLYFLFSRLFANRALSLVVALLFISHPVHNEAVVYVNSLGDSLATFFIFLSLLCYARFRQSSQRCLSSWNYYMALLMFPLALMSKETGFVLFALIPITDFLLLQKSLPVIQRIKNTCMHAWPFALMASIYIVLRATVLNFSNSFNFYNQDNEFTTSIAVRLFTFFKALCQYAGFLFFPYDPQVERSLPWGKSLLEPDVLCGGVIFIFMLWAAVRFWKQKPWITWGVLWFFAAIAPTSNILVPINAVIYEHFLYLPMIGIMCIVVTLCLGWGKTTARLSTLFKILILVLIFFAFINIRRNADWHTAIGFYEKLIKRTPDSYRVINNLGMVYANQGFHQKAEETYLKAIAADPTNPVAYHNIAGTYRDTGRKELALKTFLKAIELDPGFIFSYRSLADLEFNLKNYPEAMRYLLILRQLTPDDRSIIEAVQKLQAIMDSPHP